MWLYTKWKQKKADEDARVHRQNDFISKITKEREKILSKESDLSAAERKQVMDIYAEMCREGAIK